MGLAPDGDQQLIAAELLARRQLERELAGVAARGRGRVGADPNVDAQIRERLGHQLPANGSSPGSRRSDASTIATRAPSVDQAWPSSHPTTPPPRTVSRFGTCIDVVPARLVQGAISSSPEIGGNAAPLPVAITTARRASISSSPTRTRRSPSNLAWPRISVIDRSSSHGRWPESSRSWIDLVAALERGLDVELAGHRLLGARVRAGPRRAARPGAAAPWTACTRRTSTRRRRARARRAPRRGPRRELARAYLTGRARPDHDHVVLAHSHHRRGHPRQRSGATCCL